MSFRLVLQAFIDYSGFPGSLLNQELQVKPQVYCLSHMVSFNHPTLPPEGHNKNFTFDEIPGSQTSFFL